MRGVARTARERGAALILVLWTFAALTALAGEFARAMREDAQSTKNFKEETISHYVAIAAINEALLAIETYNGQIDVNADDRAVGSADVGRGGNRAREQAHARPGALAARAGGEGVLRARQQLSVERDLAPLVALRRGRPACRAEASSGPRR